MRVSLLVCLFGLTLFQAAAAEQPNVQSPKLPKIEVVGCNTNTMGKISSYITQTVRFRIKNSGEAAAEILNLRPTCPCVTGTTSKTRLEPKEEAEITLQLDPATVHGNFKRGLWVESNDPINKRCLLVLQGEVVPLFLGEPASSETVRLKDEGSVWTNRFTLTATETNLFLGNPKILTDFKHLATSLTIVTNTSPAATSFDVTLIVTALKTGRFLMKLSLPAEGRTEKLRTITLSYDIHVGTELKITPTKILLTPTEQSLSRKLLIQTSEKNVSPEALSWTPQRPGVSVTVSPANTKANLRVVVAFSPEAVKALLKEKEPMLTFHYPNYRSKDLTFVPASTTATPANEEPKAP